MDERPRKIVLVVDDLPEQRDIYCTLLRLHGFDVLEAADGEQAVSLALVARPHVILMDVVLPVLDGWEATRRLKADPGTAAIPIIVLTARATVADRETTRAAGADTYLSKPCEPRTVLQEVQRYTKGGGDP